MLIVIDGIDGAGKTTLAETLAQFLVSQDPLLEKEPTENSEWGRRLKESAELGRLSRADSLNIFTKIGCTTYELEYFHKDRLHHLSTVVTPALQSGRIVIMDRYVDSTLAYQSSSPEEAESLYQTFLPEIVVPDITLILDCPAELGLKRIADSRNGSSTFEVKDTLKLAQQIYHSRQGANYVHIDARGSKEDTLSSAVEVLRSRFGNLRSVLPKPSRRHRQREVIDPGDNMSRGVVGA